jgi:hypothetical protein
MALKETCERLWKRKHLVALKFFCQFVDPDKADEWTSEAFWNALEDMDMLISGGKLLTEPISETSSVTQQDCNVFRGKVSGRKFSERKRFEWRGEKKFLALFGRILMARCWDIMQTAGPQCSPLESTRDENEYAGCVYEDEVAGATLDPEVLLLEREALIAQRNEVIALVEGLAQIAEQLLKLRDEAIAETIKCLILYVKWKAASANSRKTALGFDHIQSQSIENLIDDSGLESIDFNGVWEFIQENLKINRNTVYKRKERLLRQLAELPAVPASLRKTVGLLWLEDMKHWVIDSATTAERFLQQGNVNEAQVLRLVELYLRWKFKEGYPIYCGRSLDWAQNATAETLFETNNPDLLTPSYPTANDFHKFVRQFYPDKDDLVVAMSRLQQSVESLKPRPIRLVRLIKDLLQPIEWEVA